MVAATLSAVAEAAKDCRVLILNVRNLCETSDWFWICVGMVIVILMVLSGRPFVNPIGQMTEVGRRRPTRKLHNHFQRKMSSSIMRRYPDPDSAWNLIACGAELWNFGHEICKNHLDSRAVNPVCVKLGRVLRDDSLRCSHEILFFV